MPVKNYRLIPTEDGTSSLYSDEYSQAMHTVSGAYEEALKKHVIPSKILDLESDEIRVLDLGFGLGYNMLALICEFLRKDKGRKLNIISFEKDFSYIPLLNEISFDDRRQCVYDNILKAVDKGSFEFNNYKIEIIKGDARDSIRKFKDSSLDAVFHDPYSPAQNPELWTVDFFKEVNRAMKQLAILTTYSSAMQIRMALIEAGFIVGKGPSVGMKREGTLACKSGQMQGLSEDEKMELVSDYKSVPYRDESLQNSRDAILDQRKNSIREIRKRI
ncbi:MAG: hypothetical protein JW864_14110 [Spirochaetes bacterium]|nr:hypothetical protein [Spirochaetota bacterium]